MCGVFGVPVGGEKNNSRCFFAENVWGDDNKLTQASRLTSPNVWGLYTYLIGMI